MLTAGIGAALYCFAFTNWYITALLISLSVILLMVEMIRYVNKTNRDLASFLLAVKHHDFTLSFRSDNRGRSFKELKHAFNEVIESFQNLRLSREVHYQYLQTVVEHIKTGLICFDEQGEVALFNKAAKQLLQLPYLQKIQSLDKIDPVMAQTIWQIAAGSKELVRLQVGNEPMQISLRATDFKMQDKLYKLVSLQNIRSELDEREAEAWQKLIRVLTHEIMNSVTPVSSLTSTLKMILEDENGNIKSPNSLDAEVVLDLHSGISAIEDRSKGLLNFVQVYRKLTRIPQPNLKVIPVDHLFSQVTQLLKKQLADEGVQLEVVPATDLVVNADADLIQQVLINLVLNAGDAVKLSDAMPKRIILSASRHKEGHTLIHVSDNGPGMDKDTLDKIFVPFFTTKKHGSGIGLSFSRQVMRLHKGDITVSAIPGETVFTLSF